MDEDMDGVCPKCGKCTQDSDVMEFAVIEIMLCPCGYAFDKASGVDVIGAALEDGDAS